MSSLEPMCHFLRNPCSLEHLASVVSAAVLLRQAATMNRTNRPEKVQETITLPPAIQKKVDRFMPVVQEQITSWSIFYNREIFFDKQYRRAREYFHVLVWSDDGSINYEETAREMLKQDSITATQKYRIACNHCLKNEIRTLWSNLKTKVSLRKAERCHPLVYYWECICRKKGKTTGLTKYIVERVFNGENVYPVCAVDYFLNLSTLEKRIKRLKERYLQKMPFRSWENFLMKLTNEELLSLFYDEDENKQEFLYELDIFNYLMRFWMHADFVVQIWIRIRDWYDESTFSGLIGEFFRCDRFDFHTTDHISLAVKIFNLAPPKWQRTVLADYIGDDWWMRDVNLTDVRLDVAILSTASPNYRRQNFWAVQWIDLFQRYPTDCFLQFMEVCCEEEGIEEFKMEVMEINDNWSPNLYNILMCEMRFSEIDRFLRLMSSDVCRIMKIKQMILGHHFFESTDWIEREGLTFPPPIELVDFIEESFENIRLANEFKIKILLSIGSLKVYYKVAGSDLFSWLKEAVWMCSCSDDDFKLNKRKFIDLGLRIKLVNALDRHIPGVFKDPGWMSFLEWCSNETES